MRKKRRADGNLRTRDKFEMRQYREAGASILQIADMWDVSIATVMRALAEMREKLGPERLPPNKQQLARHHLSTGMRHRTGNSDEKEPT